MSRDELALLVRSHADPWYFLTQCVVTQDRLRGPQPFPGWAFLRPVVRALQQERLIVVLKSRQMMLSWTVSAYLLYECICRGDCDQIVISKREEEAREILNRIRFMYHRLPACLRVETGTDNVRALEFPRMRSRIISLPSSPDIGRTYSPSRIFWDEMAFTPNDEEVFQSLQPSLDGGGRFIGVSSSNGPYTKHGQLCLDPAAYGFTRLDLHYRQHPAKNAAWEAEARKGMSVEQWNREQEMSLDAGGRRVYERFDPRRHVVRWALRPDLPVYRAIDFGYHTPVVLWMQATLDDRIVVIREWVGRDNTLSEMLSAIRENDAALGVADPAAVITYCDPAGAQKNDDGISPVDALRAAGLTVDYRASTVESGVNLVREKLQDAAGAVKLLVDAGCRRVIEDFLHYCKKPHSDEPDKDNITDHTMDALRYFVVNHCRCDAGRYRPAMPRVAGIERY